MSKDWNPNWERLHDEEDTFKPSEGYWLSYLGALCVDVNILINSTQIDDITKVKQSIINIIK